MNLRKYQNQCKKLTIKRKGEVLKKLQKNKCKKRQRMALGLIQGKFTNGY